MEIVHVITTISRGGAEKQLLILAREQVLRGHLVKVMYLKGSPELEVDFAANGITVLHTLSGKSFVSQIRLLKHILSESSSVIHAHLPRAELLVALSSNSKPFVFSRHNDEKFLSKFPKWISGPLARFTSRRGSEGIAISNAVLDFLNLNSEICLKTPVSVIYYGFDKMDVTSDTNLEISRKGLGISLNDYVIGTIGRIVPQKDYPTMLVAFQKLLGKFASVKLVIIGEGYQLKEMQKLVQDLGIEDKVIWIGKTPFIYSYLRIMDTFVLTSKYEGFGLVLLEALSAGVPIVASRASAISEVLGEEYEYLCVPTDTDDFAAKLLKLVYLDAASKVELGGYLESRKLLFDSGKMCDEILAIYAKCYT